MQTQAKTILTTNELSEKLNLSHTTIWRLRRSGKIPFFKAGKTVLFDYNEVLESLKNSSFVGGQK
ncbi:MAG: helix-turn-helix domain-containing protein [Chlorobiota bacterium]